MSSSQSSAPVLTAEQPTFHPTNVAAHPGSTAAGLGLASVLFGQLAQNGIPSNTQGWLQFAMLALGGLGAVFGK